jgi:GT2 family glycosyltransferase
MRVSVCGKSFVLGTAPFRFRALELGNEDVDRLPGRLAGIAAGGYTVVILPPSSPSLVAAARESGLRFLLDHDGDANTIDQALATWQGDEALIGVLVPSVAAAQHVHHADPNLLAGFRGTWPDRVTCPGEFDYLVVDCPLARVEDLRPALMASHSEVGDRPLVLGRVPESSEMQWVTDVALECGAAGLVGALEWHGAVSTGVNHRAVRDLRSAWPSISVVVNAYNAADTIEECLSHCERLDYPELEVIVVDDGSTDGTAELATAHERVRVISIAHRGLSEGRNVGYRAARGELVAYLDADAYPSPQWPWYLALAAMGPDVGGCGGPNVPPRDDPVPARVVARSPGGPVPQLRAPDRARHLPGCNMAFWKHVLERLGGFDPVLEGAEDVELQWRLLESGYELAYHPAALVWHHRRPGLGPYLRQQRHYGRSQAILERRYPERFPAGQRLKAAAARARPLGGGAGLAPAPYPVRYRSLGPPAGARLELAHQWGMPAAMLLSLTAPLALRRRRWGAPAALAAAHAAALFALDVRLAGEDLPRAERRLRFTAAAAAHRLVRPLAFRWGHLTGWRELRASAPGWPARPGA